MTKPTSAPREINLLDALGIDEDESFTLFRVAVSNVTRIMRPEDVAAMADNAPSQRHAFLLGYYLARAYVQRDQLLRVLEERV